MSHVWSDEEVKSLKLLLRKISEKFEYEEDIKEAKVVAKLLSEITPNDHEAWYFIGVLNGILGELDQAQNNLFRSLELGGDKFLIYAQLANVFMNQGNFKEAIKWGYKAHESDPANIFVCHKIANIHVLDGDTGKAIKFLESLLKIPTIQKEDLYKTLVQLGNFCMQTQHMKKALKYFKTAQKLNELDESLWAYIGHCLSRLGDKEGALSAFKKAAYSKSSRLNLYNLGDAYLAINNPEKAIAPLVEATRKKLDYSLAHYDLSLAFIELKKYHEGVAASIAALRSDPEMKLQRTNLGLGAMGNLGLCFMNLNRYEEALGCFSRNMKLIGPTYFNTGLTLFKMKRYKEALSHFQKALETNPLDPEYLDLCGQTYTELGKYKIAEKYLRQSIKSDSNYAFAHYDLGILFTRMKNRQKQAYLYFEKAIKLDPNMAWAYYSVACLHALSGNREMALDYLKQSFEKGFSSRNHIDSDADLNSLREEREFKKLMIKYFSKKSN